MQARCRKGRARSAVLAGSAADVAGARQGRPLRHRSVHPWSISPHPCQNTLNPSTRPVLLTAGALQGTQLLAMSALCLALSRCAFWQFQILLFPIARVFPAHLEVGSSVGSWLVSAVLLRVARRAFCWFPRVSGRGTALLANSLLNFGLACSAIWADVGLRAGPPAVLYRRVCSWRFLAQQRSASRGAPPYVQGDCWLPPLALASSMGAQAWQISALAC